MRAVRTALAAAGMTDPIAQQIHVVALRRAVEQAMRMKPVALTVNGRTRARRRSSRARISPISCARTQGLTGTHLGCEHGVCGACTLLIDGAPARSCITYAVACDGADVTHHRRLRRRRDHGASCARPSRASTRCNAAIARPAC